MLFLTEGAALLECLSQHMARNKKMVPGERKLNADVSKSQLTDDTMQEVPHKKRPACRAMLRERSAYTFPSLFSG